VAYAVCGISTDITERKRSDESLYQREKLAALGSLLAGWPRAQQSAFGGRGPFDHARGGNYPAAQPRVEDRIAAERCARIVRTFLAMARQQQPRGAR